MNPLLALKQSAQDEFRKSDWAINLSGPQFHQAQSFLDSLIDQTALQVIDLAIVEVMNNTNLSNDQMKTVRAIRALKESITDNK